MSREYSSEQTERVHEIERNIARCTDTASVLDYVGAACIEYLRTVPDYILSLIYLYLPIAEREKLLAPRARLLFAMGRILVDRMDLARARDPLMEAQSLFLTLGLPDQAIRCRVTLADGLHQKGYLHRANEELQEILSESISHGLPCSLIHGNIGANYNDMGMWKEARYHLYQALKSDLPPAFNTAAILSQLAMAWAKSFQPLAWYYLSRAEPLLRDYTIMYPEALETRALLLYPWSWSRACVTLLKAYRLSHANEDHLFASQVLVRLVNWYLDNGKLALAASHVGALRQHFEGMENLRVAHALASTLLRLARSHQKIIPNENWETLCTVLKERLEQSDPLNSV